MFDVFEVRWHILTSMWRKQMEKLASLRAAAAARAASSSTLELEQEKQTHNNMMGKLQRCRELSKSLYARLRQDVLEMKTSLDSHGRSSADASSKSTVHSASQGHHRSLLRCQASLRLRGDCLRLCSVLITYLHLRFHCFLWCLLSLVLAFSLACRWD